MQYDSLPPLPRPDLGMPWRVNAVSDGAAHSSGFTGEQMRAYALQERAAERERCAAWLETQRNETPAQGREFAAALRALGPNAEFSGARAAG